MRFLREPFDFEWTPYRVVLSVVYLAAIVVLVAVL